MERVLGVSLAALLAAAPALAQGTAPSPLEVMRAVEQVVDGDAAAQEAVLRAAAEAGDSRAQVYYGELYEFGDLGSVDLDTASRWYEAAAAQGYAFAYFRLGEVHYYGAEGIPADMAKAREFYAQGAALGEHRSEGAFGYMMLYGEGGPKDEALGIAYLKAAAREGDQDAAVALGYAYETGLGVAEDVAEARRLYGVAAAQGSAVGLNNLGYFMLNGFGGPQDPEQGQAHLLESMAQDYARAGSNMAEFVLAHPEADSRPLAAAAYCVWARDIATWQDADGDWDCVAKTLEGLSPDELKAAGKLAETLVPPAE